jgi:hypoxanthine-DNA glycosylase
MDQWRHIKQPFTPWIDSNTKILILGSFPSVKAVANSYYYGNPQNRFYDTIGALINVDLLHDDAESKKRKLLNHGIGIYDVVARCSINGSSDASMKNIEVIDIERLLRNHSIRHIFLNGSLAGRLFDKYYPRLENMRSILPSTSPANARFRREDLLVSWSKILEYLE